MAVAFLDKTFPRDISDIISKKIHNLRIQDVNKEIILKVKNPTYVILKCAFSLDTNGFYDPFYRVFTFATAFYPDFMVYLDSWSCLSTYVYMVFDKQNLIAYSHNIINKKYEEYICELKINCGYISAQREYFNKDTDVRNARKCFEQHIEQIFKEKLQFTDGNGTLFSKTETQKLSIWCRALRKIFIPSWSFYEQVKYLY